jgi:hypothetical protein
MDLLLDLGGLLALVYLGISESRRRNRGEDVDGRYRTADQVEADHRRIVTMAVSVVGFVVLVPVLFIALH